MFSTEELIWRILKFVAILCLLILWLVFQKSLSKGHTGTIILTWIVLSGSYLLPLQDQLKVDIIGSVILGTCAVYLLNILFLLGKIEMAKNEPELDILTVRVMYFVKPQYFSS